MVLRSVGHKQVFYAAAFALLAPYIIAPAYPHATGCRVSSRTVCPAPQTIHSLNTLSIQTPSPISIHPLPRFPSCCLLPTFPCSRRTTPSSHNVDRHLVPQECIRGVGLSPSHCINNERRSPPPPYNAIIETTQGEHNPRNGRDRRQVV